MAKSDGKSMPVSGSFTFGNASGQPTSTSKVVYGSDLRDGKKGK